METRRVRRGVAVLAITLTLGACAKQEEKKVDPDLSRADLVKTTQQQLPLTPEEAKAVTVTCEGDLPGEKDAEQTCWAAGPTGRMGYHYRVSKVTKGVPSYAIAYIGHRDDMAAALRQRYAADGVKAVRCQDHLLGEKGEQALCEIDGKFEGKPAKALKVTATGMNGLEMVYDVEAVR